MNTILTMVISENYEKRKARRRNFVQNVYLRKRSFYRPETDFGLEEVVTTPCNVFPKGYRHW